jgi:hypothetical protein
MMILDNFIRLIAWFLTHKNWISLVICSTDTSGVSIEFGFLL